MISVNELKQAINERLENYLTSHLGEVKTTTVGLLEAQNHILAQDIAASFDIPRQNLSSMDGFAIAMSSYLDHDSQLEIIGESGAGKPFNGRLRPNQGVRIFTGAVVPNDCDTVVMQEDTNLSDIQPSLDNSQAYHIRLTQTAKLGANIRRQGEEVQAGETVLTIGKRLNPTDISLLANLGVDSVQVFQPLTVGIIATGDELVDVGQPLATLAQIYNSNTPTLKALLKQLPIAIQDYGIVPDNLETTRRTVQHAIAECDVIISTAGVSVGDYDFLTQVIQALGKIHHYKVAMKPGTPFIFGE